MSTVRNPHELGAQLRAARRAAGLTQAQVATSANVSRAFVIDLEQGKRPGAELSRVLAVARALHRSFALVEDARPSFDAALDDFLGS
ncbi:helix-turn-helix domain-containing protein [Sanguibacter antarcticus]|uniref:Helix-turn-helix protein n=1 Tax=Sanguibacter antarcticus TaxID=372484 RepID=A0A2A9EA46_9MICO|nr:helix-turn-helix domain-containing protein [Sanguibacter antarcticus]PFG35090.1 helix-turn-helix protein [Sanguibacter antarcticus]